MPGSAARWRNSPMSARRSCSIWRTTPIPACASAVAENRATPRQADLILTRDDDEFGARAARGQDRALVPEFAGEEREKIRALSHQVLETLARDQAVKVRQIVAEALKDSVDAPVAVIQKLARDIEIQVAGPILEYSPLLTDEDLLEIIAHGPIRGALTAIAKRRQLSDKLSDGVAVAALADPGAESNSVRKLLQNKSAQIREDTLDRILDQAGKVPTWHEPLVERPTLPMKAIKRLAAFVSRTLLEALQQRPDLDAATAKDVAKTVQRRLEAEGAAVGGAAGRRGGDRRRHRRRQARRGRRRLGARCQAAGQRRLRHPRIQELEGGHGAGVARQPVDAPGAAAAAAHRPHPADRGAQPARRHRLSADAGGDGVAAGAVRDGVGFAEKNRAEATPQPSPRT